MYWLLLIIYYQHLLKYCGEVRRNSTPHHCMYPLTHYNVCILASTEAVYRGVLIYIEGFHLLVRTLDLHTGYWRV